MKAKIGSLLIKTSCLFFLPLFTFLSFPRMAPAVDYYGTFPTGLLQLERNWPYYLFVPAEYSPERTWPIFVLMGNRDQDPKEIIEPWLDWAKAKSVLLLAVPNPMPVTGIAMEGDEEDQPITGNPFEGDEWLLDVMREVAERYHIDSSQILLVGFGDGGHYAAYLGLKYPKEFTAAVLVKQAWAGPMGRLMRPVANGGNQTPFFVAADPEAADYAGVEKKALELENKGYRVTLESSKAADDLAVFQDRIYEWFRNQSEARILAWEKPPKRGWWENFKEWLHNFLEV